MKELLIDQSGSAQTLQSALSDQSIELSELSLNVFSGRVKLIYRDEVLNTMQGHLKLMDGAGLTQRQLRGVYPLIEYQFLVTRDLSVPGQPLEQRIQRAMEIQALDCEQRQIIFNHQGKVAIVNKGEEFESLLLRITSEDPDDYSLIQNTDFDYVSAEGYGEMIYFANLWQRFCGTGRNGSLVIKIRDTLSSEESLNLSVNHRTNSRGELLLDLSQGIDLSTASQLAGYISEQLGMSKAFFIHNLAAYSVELPNNGQTALLQCLAAEGEYLQLLDQGKTLGRTQSTAAPMPDMHLRQIVR